jgi:hypothetical protein
VEYALYQFLKQVVKNFKFLEEEKGRFTENMREAFAQVDTRSVGFFHINNLAAYL